jgi:predicted rRNA methylase YqxC with S4 and FtsJ domains
MTCVDVGTAQVPFQLRNDPRIKNLEKFNAREINNVEAFPACDLRHRGHGPFVHLAGARPADRLAASWGRAAASSRSSSRKFEATKAEADKGRGVVEDPAIPPPGSSTA